MILVRTRPSLYLPAIMAVWGVLTCIMAVIHKYEHLVILRVFVGIAELVNPSQAIVNWC
jgi:hypothetical protein